MPDSQDHRGPGTRTKARKRALDILFEADLRGDDPLETLADRISLGEPPVRDFTRSLVQGVETHRDEIDDLIVACLTGAWTLERMPRVDRALARLAVFEILSGDVAGEIAVDEAVSLASELSTDESPAFLNGLLGAVMRRLGEQNEGPDAEGASPDVQSEGSDAESENLSTQGVSSDAEGVGPVADSESTDAEGDSSLQS